MKAVKLILIALGLLIGFFLIAGLIAPKEVSVQRSIKIKAPPIAVFPHIKFMDKMAKWHPWLKHDPKLVTSVIGTEGTVGAVRQWESDNAEVGSGQETILTIEDNAYLETEVTIEKPRKSHGINRFSLVDAGGNTQVIWQFKYEVPYPFNAMMIFSSPDGYMGEKFTEGLTGLKNILERNERTSVKYLMNEHSLQSKTYAYKRAQMSASEMNDFAVNTLKELQKKRVDSGFNKAGFPVGMIFSWDKQKDVVDYAFGIPVLDEKTLSDVEFISIDATNKAKTIFINDLYNNQTSAHDFMRSSMNKQSLNVIYPVLEIYMKGPLSETSEDVNSATRIVYRYEE